jgi:polar amino acid transport system substrate-binding protein
MNLDRRSFYEKELELRMSMSYGPGRYDRRYEELGLDYPIEYVRWTENRNLQAFLELAASRAVDPGSLDAEIVDFAGAEAAYEALAAGQRRGLGVIFRYADAAPAETSLALAARHAKASDELGVAFVGAGNYAKAVLLPALAQVRGTSARRIVTATGPSAKRSAEKFGFAECGTDPRAVFDDSSVDLVFVATQHDSHAALAEAALRAGKAVWLEKPVALDELSLQSLARALQETGGFLAVGYNRRFSSHAQVIRECFAKRGGPMALHYTVAAGPTPGGTWIVDPRSGGGRIVGEACHMVDLCSFLVGTAPTQVFARALGRDPESDDSMLLVLGFADGSTATIAYLANASPDLPKERFEVSADGRTASCENFRETHLPGGRRHRTLNQDKGQTEAVKRVVEAVRAGSPSPFSLGELLAVSRATLRAEESSRTGAAVALGARAGDLL